MSRLHPPAGYYYYVSGKPVRLTLDDEWVAVDSQRSGAADPNGNLSAALRDASRPLRGDLVLVRRDALSSQQLAGLADEGAIQPVFLAEGARLVALPEVRVEESSPEGQEILRHWIRGHREEAEIVQDRGDRIVLRPTSGRGRDALTLANRLTEQVGPEMAQPRFLRIVDRSDR